MNEIVGVLESVKHEFERRVVDCYEDKKREENGDVYDESVVKEVTPPSILELYGDTAVNRYCTCLNPYECDSCKEQMKRNEGKTK